MAIYKSAMGKPVDMSALAAVNDRVRAVGNGKMNARGDVIDSQGRVIKPNTTKINEIYAKTVTNRSATPSATVPADVAPVQPRQIITDDQLSTLTPQEQELEDMMGSDAEIEKIKAAEIKRDTKGKR